MSTLEIIVENMYNSSDRDECNIDSIEKITNLNDQELIARIADWLQGNDPIPCIRGAESIITSILADSIRSTLKDYHEDGFFDVESDGQLRY